MRALGQSYTFRLLCFFCVGVPNPQLIEEDDGVARRYKSRSVAEQKSLDLSWDLLMEDRFANLRSTICRGSEAELRRFRQIVINSVMATDLGDKGKIFSGYMTH